MKAINRLALLWTGLLLSTLACAPGQANRTAFPERWSVAVLDYEDLSPYNTEHPDLSELLTIRAIETIAEGNRFDVVERQHLAKVLDELNLGTSEVVDRQTRLKLGEITGARLMVFGSYQVIENQLRLDVRLVDVESGRVLHAVSLMAQEHNLSGWLDASTQSINTLLRIEQD